MYMNKTKRNLILAGAIINLIGVSASLILSIVMSVNPNALSQYQEYFVMISYSTNLVYDIISFVIGFVGSFLLIYSVRSKGKYFRINQGIFYAGFIITVFFGGFLPWILLLVSLFIPDIIIMNRPSEVRREEVKEERAYEEKKKRIEDLKRMRDNGLITEEEYKEKLFELL